jgi:putative addiction module component (TIGR02574 family)
MAASERPIAGDRRIGRTVAGAWYGTLVAAPNLTELLALDVQTRLALVQKLWDSILKDAQGGAELPVSEAERAELDNRLREDDEHPDAAISWTEARARLRSGS